MNHRLTAAALVAATLSFLAHGEATKIEPKITDAWARTTVPGQSVSGAYMHITSSTPMKLVKAESPVAGMTEIHLMQMKDGVMSMGEVDGVDIVPGKITELKPGGFHIMLMQIKAPIKAGDSVPLTLTFQDAAKKTQSVTIWAKAQAKPASGHHH